MQAARNLVGILVEFAAGMELGHDDFGRRNAFAVVDVDGNAAAVVAHRHRTVGVERHLTGGMAGQRLVDGVVDDLVDHVMQAGAVVGVADIHAGTLADGIEPLQNPDGFRAVLAGNGRLGFGEASAGQVLSCEAFEDVESAAQKRGAESAICATKEGCA